jgi:uncharacterized protein YhhL (DUF1145 family)
MNETRERDEKHLSALMSLNFCFSEKRVKCFIVSAIFSLLYTPQRPCYKRNYIRTVPYIAIWHIFLLLCFHPQPPVKIFLSAIFMIIVHLLHKVSILAFDLLSSSSMKYILLIDQRVFSIAVNILSFAINGTCMIYSFMSHFLLSIVMQR